MKLTDGAALPRHAKPGDAGLDLTSRNRVVIEPGETVMVHTGVAVEIPDGFCGLVLPRSGVASKRGLAPVNAPGLIDSGYRGEVLVPLHNYNQAAFACQVRTFADGLHDELMVNREARQVVEEGERIAQLVVVPFATCECVEVGELSESERGQGGFGSSGMM